MYIEKTIFRKEKIMASLSPLRAQVPVYEGIELVNRGKVRDTYALDDGNLLMVATDGISIFDFVLNALIPEKGRILTAMSHFWFKMLEEHGIATHLIVAGSDIDRYIPSALRGNFDLQSRAMVVRKLFMRPVEFIARGYLTGSALDAYYRDNMVWVCGHRLGQGLQDGDALPRVLDTPTTKAEVGHDKPLDPYMIRHQYPEETYRLIAAYQIISSYARSRGIILADTKFEFGVDEQKIIRIADEAGTGDSSRFWDALVWDRSRTSKENRKAPAPFDKQIVRAWGIGCGINKNNPGNSHDTAHVHGLELPERLIAATTATYRYIFWRLTGMTVENYFEKLGVALPVPQKRVAIVAGSETDVPAVREAVDRFLQFQRKQVSSIVSHVVSCHRNPFEQRDFVLNKCHEIDVIVSAGGKAFALPGVLDAWLYASGQEIPVIGVALGSLGTESFDAAKLSIKELPGCPVVMDEIHGEVYAGVEGIVQALTRINEGELPPPRARVVPPAQFDKTLFVR